MSIPPDLWNSERRLWLGGVGAFRQLMAPDCVMAFPGMGVIAGEAIIDGLRDAPRWSDVDMAEAAHAHRDGTVILAYLATGRREGQDDYRAACVSTWIRDGGDWRILAHQHTPL